MTRPADKWVFRVFAACFVASLFTGCSTFEGSAYGDVFNRVDQIQYDAPLVLKSGTRTVHLWIHTPAEVERLCGPRVMGCYRPQLDGTAVVIAVAPKSWNDHKTLAVLGHEFAHAYGSKHE